MSKNLDITISSSYNRLIRRCNISRIWMLLAVSRNLRGNILKIAWFLSGKKLDIIYMILIAIWLDIVRWIRWWNLKIRKKIIRVFWGLIGRFWKFIWRRGRNAICRSGRIIINIIWAFMTRITVSVISILSSIIERFMRRFWKCSIRK